MYFLRKHIDEASIYQDRQSQVRPGLQETPARPYPHTLWNASPFCRAFDVMRAPSLLHPHFLNSFHRPLCQYVLPPLDVVQLPLLIGRAHHPVDPNLLRSLVQLSELLR